MWLLTSGSNGEISIAGPFARNKTPRYAILSHTWGQDSDEVRLQDIRGGTAKSKAGWQKISFCHKQAAAHGLSYFWIDTCCIDKTSSAELTEAINSMYRWYREADRCYVYLQDVTTGGTQNWEDSFQSSRWMTRGWTLQELLAPSSVEFFSLEGQLLGNKDSLAEAISKATTIPAAVLLSLSPTRFSRHEIMRWGQRRITTLEEDKVYCMLGLFQVSLPVIYGEGYEQACIRLDDVLHRKCGHPLRLNDEEQVSNHAELNEADKSYLRSLWFPSMNTRYIEVNEPIACTSSWFFEHSSYRDWEKRYTDCPKNKLLWVKGSMGVGKSVLLKEAVRRISASSQGTTELVASFFFNSKGQNLDWSPLGLFRSLLFQLLQQHRGHLRRLSTARHDELILQTETKGTSGHSWSLRELMTTFSATISAISVRSVTIFIDALDECDGNELRSQAEFWRDIVRKSSNLRVLISCRYYPTLTAGLYPTINVENHNQHDIKNYVNRRFDGRLSSTGGYWDLLQGWIIAKSRGVFLWVVLVLDDLLAKLDNGHSARYLSDRLNVVPSDLADFFDYTLREIEQQGGYMSLSVIYWAVLAIKPLRVDEWYNIMAITQRPPVVSLRTWQKSPFVIDTDEQLEKSLRALSRGLVEVGLDAIDDVPDTVSFMASAGSLNSGCGGTRFIQVIHSSVCDHFLSTSLNSSSVCFKFNGHLRILNDCLNYIALEEFDEFVAAKHAVVTREAEIARVARKNPMIASIEPMIASIKPRIASIEARIASIEAKIASTKTGRALMKNLSAPRGVGQDTGLPSITIPPLEPGPEYDNVVNVENTEALSPLLRMAHQDALDPCMPQQREETSNTSRAQSMESCPNLIEDSGGILIDSLHARQSSPDGNLGTKRKATSLVPEQSTETKRVKVSEDTYQPLGTVCGNTDELHSSVRTWLIGLDEITDESIHHLRQQPSKLPHSTAPSVSSRGTVKTKPPRNHMALHSYVVTYFLEHARLLQELHRHDIQEPVANIIDRFCEQSQWRRWQVLDHQAPCNPGIDAHDLQCDYFDQVGLTSWARYRRQPRGLSEVRVQRESGWFEPTNSPGPAVQRSESVASFSSAGSHKSSFAARAAG